MLPLQESRWKYMSYPIRKSALWTKFCSCNFSHLEGIPLSSQNSLSFPGILSYIIVEEEKHQATLQNLDYVYNGEIESGCMCHPQVNTTGNWLYYCGYELKPHNSTSKCVPHAFYKCVNGRKVAIQTTIDCSKSGKKCEPKLKDAHTGAQCEFCILHSGKRCNWIFLPWPHTFKFILIMFVFIWYMFHYLFNRARQHLFLV